LNLCTLFNAIGVKKRSKREKVFPFQDVIRYRKWMIKPRNNFLSLFSLSFKHAYFIHSLTHFPVDMVLHRACCVCAKGENSIISHSIRIHFPHFNLLLLFSTSLRFRSRDVIINKKSSELKRLIIHVFFIIAQKAEKGIFAEKSRTLEFLIDYILILIHSSNIWCHTPALARSQLPPKVEKEQMVFLSEGIIINLHLHCLISLHDETKKKEEKTVFTCKCFELFPLLVFNFVPRRLF
jgi:hypothetical protein